jgi:hypothetical protein
MRQAGKFKGKKGPGRKKAGEEKFSSPGWVFAAAQ